MTMQHSRALEHEYARLLKESGLQVPKSSFPPWGMIAAFFDETWQSYLDHKWDGDFASFVRLVFPGAIDGRDPGPEDIALFFQRVENLSPGDNLLSNINTMIRTIVDERHAIKKHDTLVVEYPTGEFNAKLHLVNSGGLIMINTGVFALLHEVARIMLLSMKFSEEVDGEQKIIVFGPEKNQVEYTKKQQVEAITELILAYLSHRDSYKVMRLPTQVPPREKMAYLLMEAGVMFTVAHEFAHLVTMDRCYALPSEMESYHPQLKEWQKEVVADSIGMELMLMAMASKKDGDQYVIEGDPIYWTRVENIMAAPLLFLELDLLLTQVVCIIAGIDEFRIIADPNRKHPPSQLRKELVQSQLEKLCNPLPSLARAYLLVMEQLGNDVKELVREKLPEIRARFSGQ
jgi:hypothetical protein